MALLTWLPVQYQPIAEPVFVPTPTAPATSSFVAASGAVMVSIMSVQYQSIAEPVFVPSPGIGWMPGFPVVFGQDVVQYQALAAPVFVIPKATPPAGLDAWISTFPVTVPGRAPLPTGAMPHTVFNTLPRAVVMASAALSWVPVYKGPPQLPTALHRSSSLLSFVVPAAGPAPLSWSSVFPDRVGQRQPGLHPTAMPSFVRHPVPIAVPLPDLSWAPSFPSVLPPRQYPSVHGETILPPPQALILPHGAPRIKILARRPVVKMAPELRAKLLRPDTRTKEAEGGPPQWPIS